ncbi:hypothetical protein ACFL35_14425, partial [Candidatus Riflebacteria bacterium]
MKVRKPVVPGLFFSVCLNFFILFFATTSAFTEEAEIKVIKNFQPKTARELLKALENSSNNIYSMRLKMKFVFFSHRFPFEFVLKNPDNFYFKSEQIKTHAVFNGKVFI